MPHARRAHVRRAGRLHAKAIVCLALAAVSLPAAARADSPTSISATNGHTCASMASGQVECWGKSYIPRSDSHVPVPFGGFTEAVAVGSGIHYDCALLKAGRVECWGDNGYGQLGNGSTVDSPVAVGVAGIEGATEIAVGGVHACALVHGQVACWGRNLAGALGDGQRRDSAVPVQVRGISDAIQVAAGYAEDETCAVLAGGSVVCWGANRFGQLGNGTKTSSATPVRVAGITTAVRVATGGQHSCAVLANGDVQCWGDGRLGQLGNGGLHGHTTPVRVKLTGAVAVANGARSYSCAAMRSGAVLCWGGNAKNQLGDGRQPHGSALPVRALGISNAISITAGTGHACSILATGGADCWGYDDYGQLGRGFLKPPLAAPTQVRF